VSRSDLDRDPDLVAIYDFTALVSASARSARQHERMVHAVGVDITGAGLLALRAVERHGPMTPSDVARRLQVDQSTASRHVAALLEQGFVRRDADPHDGRVAWLRVTPSGQRVLDRARQVVLNDFDAALSGWTADDRRTLGGLLRRLQEALLAAEVDDAGWSRPRTPARVRP
jgi:DNA-binding MarR family transcriptional regulator